MKYLCFVLCLQISFKECTVDMNIKELVYIADHLTAAECRLLFASLYFTTYSLPAALFKAAHQVPRNIPCLQLLTKWNSGAETWEGKGQTHAIVERRLRQLGKANMANWLGKMVFHHLGKEMNNSLEDELFLEKEKPEISNKLFKDSDSKFEGEKWTNIDFLLCVVLFGMVFVTLAAFCRMLKLSFKRAKIKRGSTNGEELVELISADSVESDQETVYELDVERKRSRVGSEDDLKKSTGEGSVI